MKKLFGWVPSGIPCLLIVVVLFGYLAAVMGMANMLNTMMHTAHDLLLNTCFYLMAICVLTGALGKAFVEFGVVDLIQKLLRPVMKPLFNLPGVASLGAVLTFLSDNPAIISLSKDRKFSRYFKKYQLISLTNFGTALGMGLIVIVFMIGQGYFAAPFIGFVGAMVGCIISTRCMQYFVCKDYPEYRTEDAVPEVEEPDTEYKDQSNVGVESEAVKDSTFIRILNALLDGGKSGVEIGLAIIPGVLIISTFVMMLTFGAATDVVDGKTVEVFTGAAYQGTQLLPWLAGKLNFLFDWLFGFSAPELVAFPITALGAVGAALGLIPQFAEKGIIDGNAIAVCTAMGMCWSGYLSTHTAMLDSLGYRKLLSRAFLAHFFGGIGAGVAAHWIFAGTTLLSSLFAPAPVWQTEADAWNDTTNESVKVQVMAYDDGSVKIKDWYGKEDADLCFTVNKNDSTVNITNAYTDLNGKYYFVHINEKAKAGESAYAVLYPSQGYSEYDGTEKAGHFYIFAFIYDREKTELNRCYYEVTWGGRERQTFEAEQHLEKAKAAGELLVSDSIARAMNDSIVNQ